MELASGSTGWLAESAGALWAWAVPVTLQATVLLGLAWLADRLLARRAWPQALSLLWIVALARFFLPPDLGSPVSVTRGLGAPALEAARMTPPAEMLVAAAVLWLLGAVLLVAVRAICRARLRRRLRPLTPPRAWQRAIAEAAAEIGLGAAPRIATLDTSLDTSLDTRHDKVPNARPTAVIGPAVLGALSPVLLLPRAWLERPPSRRDRHVLLHELAHVARRDLWLDEAIALVRALLWFHPLVWIAVSRLHELSELQCDQTVARALGREARAYRETLILATRDAAARAAPSRPTLGGLLGRGFLGRGSAMILRIERLERAALRSLATIRTASAALLAVLAACVLPMAPSADELRDQARATFAAAERGERRSCFHLRAAAMVLAPEESPPSSETER